MPAFDMGGLSILLAATLFIWLGGPIADVLTSHHVFKALRNTAPSKINVR